MVSFLVPLGSLLASHLGAFGRPNRPKFAPKRVLNAYLLKKRRFSRDSTISNKFCLFLFPRWLPKCLQIASRCPQDGLGTTFFRSSKSTWIWYRFGIDFGSVLAPQMPPLWHPFRDQNRSKNRSEIGLLKKSLQDRPQTAQ